MAGRLRREPQDGLAHHAQHHHEHDEPCGFHAAGTPAGILSRVLTNNELKGFKGSPQQVATNARTWLGGDQDPDVNVDQSRLTRLGFIRGARENLSEGGAAGLSAVARFRSEKAARAELAAEIAKDKSGSGGPYKAFAVPGIPDADGFSLIAGGSGGINIAFVKGPYFYLVGQEVGPSTGSISSISPT